MFLDEATGFRVEPIGEIFPLGCFFQTRHEGGVARLIRGKITAWTASLIAGNVYIKTMIRRQRPVSPQMPLAYMKSGIASFPQQLRQGNNPLGQGLEIVRAVEGLAGFGGLAGDPIGNMNSGGILTGEDSGTTGRTNRASRIGLSKHGRFRSQLVEVGGLVEGASCESQITGAKIIRHDEDNVGGFGGLDLSEK